MEMGEAVAPPTQPREVEQVSHIAHTGLYLHVSARAADARSSWLHGIAGFIPVFAQLSEARLPQRPWRP